MEPEAVCIVGMIRAASTAFIWWWQAGIVTSTTPLNIITSEVGSIVQTSINITIIIIITKAVVTIAVIVVVIITATLGGLH